VNAAAFRHLYDYHFAENRRLWAHVSTLPHEQFTRPAAYSLGSVRDQLLHLIWVDDVWFGQLRGVEPLPLPAASADLSAIRAHWDDLEQRMRDYLADLRDDMLPGKPFPDHPEDKHLLLWQVLLHVVNHGTDHRAQLLRTLNDLGVETKSQDYVFYAYDHPVR
jgi:uncharacterized damage-inducible protein DinB